MNTNHQMNYYDYAKTLSAEGVMTALIGGGSGPEPDTLDYVDLGLPSRTLWAKHNIQDADGNELYFAWGETRGYTAEQVGTVKNFVWGDDENDYPNDYKFGPYNGEDETNYGMTEYNNRDEKIELEAKDDAATQLWGSDWRMPTKEEFEELLANTEYGDFTTINGVEGLKFTSTVEGYTDKFLFFPAVGHASNGEVLDTYDDTNGCWSVSLDDDGNIRYAWIFSFEEGNSVMNKFGRYVGFSVRPVRSQNL